VAPTATFPVNAGALDGRQQLWSARRQRSQELKQLHEPDWLRYWAWYRNNVEPLDDPADWWRSNEPIPTAFKIIETLLPRYIMGMFESPDWFSVEGRNFRSEAYETLVQNLLRTTIEEMELFPLIYEAMRYAAIMGHCWGKIIWEEDYETRQVLLPTELTVGEAVREQYGSNAVQEVVDSYGEEMLEQPSGQMSMTPFLVEEEIKNGPAFEWLPLDRVFPDPSGRMRYAIEEIQITLEEIDEVQEKLKIYDAGALAELRAHVTLQRAPGTSGGLDNLGDARSGTTAGVSMEYAREPESTEGIPEWITTPMRDGTGVTLWQCWGWVPKDQRGSDGAPWRLIVIAEGKYILRDEPSPTPDGKPPYFPMKSIAIPGRLYGESILRYVGPLADQQSRLSNMRLDEVFLGVWNQFIFRKNAVVSDNAMLIQPGGAIEVDPGPGQSIDSVFSVLPRQPVLPQSYEEDMYRQTQAEHAAAATDMHQGVSSGDRTTATEIERRLQQGNARHVLQTMYNDYTVKRELLTRVWKWLQMRLTKPKLLRMAGEQAINVDLSMIQIPIDIVVGGGMNVLSKDQRVQMDQELLSMAQNPIFQPWIRPFPILKRWMQDRGWKNPEAFIKTEQEVMYEQQQQMAQQMAQEQAMAEQDMGQYGQPMGPGTDQVPPQEGNGVPPMLNPGADASMVGGQLNQG